MATVSIKAPIEIDITYTNKSWFTFKKKNLNVEKNFVIGFCQRYGKAIIDVLENDKPETIIQAVVKRVTGPATIYCETGILPDGLKNLYDIVELNVAEHEHTKGEDVHLGNIKTLWRNLKRQIKEEHIHVSRKHLQGYCDEVAWRYNTRNMTPMERFEDLFKGFATTPHRTYKDLIK